MYPFAIIVLYMGFLNSLLGFFQPQQQPKSISQGQMSSNYNFGNQNSNALNPSRAYSSGGITPYGPQNPNSGSVLGTSTYAAPQSSGQSPSGGGGAPASNQNIVQTPPQAGYQGPSEQDVTNQLKAQYGQAASDIQAQNPLLDQSYNQAKTDIGNQLTTTQQQGQNQKDQLNSQFGDVLRNELQTYRDLNKQRTGTFSSLGTLDSSAYQDQQFRADQNYANQSALTGTQKAQQLNSVDTALTSYTNQAQSQLAQLATQYQQGKNAISSALAQNNLQEASQISSALDQLRTRAQNVQNTMIQFANQAAQLKALGYGVRTNIQGFSATPFANDVNASLAQQQQLGNQMYQNQLPTGLGAQQGYLNQKKDMYGNPIQ